MKRYFEGVAYANFITYKKTPTGRPHPPYGEQKDPQDSYAMGTPWRQTTTRTPPEHLAQNIPTRSDEA